MLLDKEMVTNHAAAGLTCVFIFIGPFYHVCFLCVFQLQSQKTVRQEKTFLSE